MSQSKHIRFILIALLMILLFTFPILATVNKKVLIGGVPLLYLHIGIVWVLSIIVLYLTVNPRRK